MVWVRGVSFRLCGLKGPIGNGRALFFWVAPGDYSVRVKVMNEPELTIEVEDDETPPKTLFRAAKDALLGINTIQLWTTEDYYEFEEEDVSLLDALKAAKRCFEDTPGAVLVRLVLPMTSKPLPEGVENKPACVSVENSAVMTQVDDEGRFAIVSVVALPPTVSRGMLC